MIGMNLYKGVFPCKNPNCNEQIRQYPCCYCGFKPAPKDRVIDGERIR